MVEQIHRAQDMVIVNNKRQNKRDKYYIKIIFVYAA